MKEVIAIRHVHFENLGSFEEVLRDRGMHVRYLEAGRDRLAGDADLLVLLGGPVGAYESTAYPFLSDELSLARTRLAQDAPMLGICLGAQLIAAAAGARVHPLGAKEIGWGGIELAEAAAATPLAALTTPVLHWHGDTFDLPAGAVHLASTSQCRNQAFSLGRRTLGLQFHAEVQAAAIESWLIGHAAEIAATPGISAGGLRTDTGRHASRLEVQGRKFFHHWLDLISL
jgi:GMP synthase (glutamine-hydrolysing)